MIDLNTVSDFTFDFAGKFLLDVNGKFYVWWSPDYDGDNTIKEYKGNPADFTNVGFMGRYKGRHRIGDYCGNLVKFV